MRPDSPWRWVARVFLCLLPSFAAWHFAAGPLAAAQAGLAAAAANAWFPGLVEGWDRAGALVDFVTRVRVSTGGRAGDLVVPVNARLYSYGLALFVALCLATDLRRWRGLALGLVALLPLCAWGVAFDFLTQVFIHQGGLAARDYLPTPLERNLIAVGYQVGSLLLPTVAPVVAWGVVHRAFLRTWAAV